MTQSSESNIKYTTKGKETPEKSAHKHSYPRSMKHYSLLLVLVAITAAIVLGIILLLEQTRFFKVETTATLSYNPVTFSDKAYSPSISEVLQIIQADIVKKEAYDQSGISFTPNKEKHLKDAFAISYDQTLGPSNNMLKVSVRWDDIEEARQLIESYIKSAINTYFRIRSNYLLEIHRRLLVAKRHDETTLADIEKHLSQLAQSVQEKSLKDEFETLKTLRNRQEEELFDLKKQLVLAQIQNARLKSTSVDSDKMAKFKNGNQFAYALKLIKKRNEAQEEYEILKATANENDLQFKQAQIRYAFTDDCLKRALEEMNITEKEIIDFDPSCLKLQEELKSSEAGLIELNKHITAAQENLVQTQKQISNVSNLLPQEEKLNEGHQKTLLQVNELDQDYRNIDSHIMMTVLELQSLGFINIHPVSMFPTRNYLLAILAGIIITALFLSFLILVTELNRHPAKASTKQ